MRKGTRWKYLNYRFTIVLTLGTIAFALLNIPGQAEQAPKHPQTQGKTEPQPALKTTIPSNAPLSNFGGREVTIGNSHAPLTIVMYYSLTCPHCHDYQTHDLPKIQKEFIDKGLVRFIFRDFPTDAVAIKGAKIAWCHGAKQYISFAQKLLETQGKWALSDKALHDIATKELGISELDYQKCLVNENVESSILRSSFEAQRNFQIDAAPAFLINGKHHEGIVTTDTIHEKLLEMGIHG